MREWNRLKLEELVLESKEGRRVARGDAQFAIDGTQVGIDGARTNDQDLGDLGIGEFPRHQPQHLHLPLGQVVRSGWGRQLLAARTGRSVWGTGEYSQGVTVREKQRI